AAGDRAGPAGRPAGRHRAPGRSPSAGESRAARRPVVRAVRTDDVGLRRGRRRLRRGVAAPAGQVPGAVMPAPTSSLSAARRARELEGLRAGEPVDLLVVGLGATGAGVALDAASRGWRVVAVD